MPRQLNTTIHFDASPTELLEGLPAAEGVSHHGYVVQYRIGPEATENPRNEQVLLPIGQHSVTICGDEGDIVEMFISFVDRNGARSKSIRHFFRISPAVEPQPPARPRMGSVVPVLNVIAEPKESCGTGCGCVPAKSPALPAGEWRIVDASGVQGTPMSIDVDGVGIHVRIDEVMSKVVYPDTEVLHVIAPSGEKITLDEYLREAGLPTRSEYNDGRIG